jgi:hypothetical protein
MIVVKPFEGERINVSIAELTEMNKIVDNSSGGWTKPTYVTELFKAANAGSSEWVYLRSEGWHQYEPYNGAYYKHITLHYAKWTYHFYTKVGSQFEEITSKSHKIDSISYMDNGYATNIPKG